VLASCCKTWRCWQIITIYWDLLTNREEEKKGKQSAQYNLLSGLILAAFFIFPLIWSSAKNFSCSAVTVGPFNRTKIESGRRSRVIFRIRSRNVFAFNILCQALFLPYNVKTGVDHVCARNFLAWFRYISFRLPLSMTNENKIQWNFNLIGAYFLSSN